MFKAVLWVSVRAVLALPVVITVAAASIVWMPTPVTAAPDDPWPYVWPVDAPITDPFRPPAHPYGAGNRGLEFATDPGTVVRAARAGVVTFAGQVGGRLHITIRHIDGVRTSYSFVESVEVSRGQIVTTGAPIATAGPRVHVGARIGRAYVDPAILFGARAIVRLVPVKGDQATPLPSVPVE